eukprot:TRINITY_DN314_c0_g1_i4.p1 TRINITY_DN314_c0_g1~~TRINITY_DN314_c0_g1_i4.p1  ORF type:complete len:521 (+),score=138.31 TRINITY_DN314_c0_g1_i4:213-1775(+)
MSGDMMSIWQRLLPQLAAQADSAAEQSEAASAEAAQAQAAAAEAHNAVNEAHTADAAAQQKAADLQAQAAAAAAEAQAAKAKVTEAKAAEATARKKAADLQTQAAAAAAEAQAAMTAKEEGAKKVKAAKEISENKKKLEEELRAVRAREAALLAEARKAAASLPPGAAEGTPSKGTPADAVMTDAAKSSTEQVSAQPDAAMAQDEAEAVDNSGSWGSCADDTAQHGLADSDTSNTTEAEDNRDADRRQAPELPVTAGELAESNGNGNGLGSRLPLSLGPAIADAAKMRAAATAAAKAKAAAMAEAEEAEAAKNAAEKAMAKKAAKKAKAKAKAQDTTIRGDSSNSRETDADSSDDSRDSSDIHCAKRRHTDPGGPQAKRAASATWRVPAHTARSFKCPCGVCVDFNGCFCGCPTEEAHRSHQAAAFAKFLEEGNVKNRARLARAVKEDADKHGSREKIYSFDALEDIIAANEIKSDGASHLFKFNASQLAVHDKNCPSGALFVPTEYRNQFRLSPVFWEL